MWNRLCVAVLAAAAAAFAGVVRIEGVDRTDLLGGESFGSAGPYERIVAKAYFAIDPKQPANQIITDIALAPRNRKGLVEFSADLYVLKPRDPAKGNGTAFFEVSNRGRKGLLSTFNFASGSLDPRTASEFGDRFLLERGYTLVWLGWQFDVPLEDELMRLSRVVPSQDGKPITGLVRADFVPDRRVRSHSLSDRNHIVYPVLDPKDASIQLTVRDRIDSARRTVPREAWRFAREENGKAVDDNTHVYMEAGFEPGKIYEVVYRSSDPGLVGLGPAAVRDLISFLKYGNQDAGKILLGDQRRFLKRAIGFGTSQSGRFLRTFVYQGFNQDENGKIVFDGVWSHVPGASMGSFNHRFAQPSRDAQPHMNFFYPTVVFPFTDLEQTDPETGLADALLAKASKAGVAPKIFYTNGSYEYWGRSASLIHTTLDGKADAPLAKDTRVYLIAGAQHGPGSYPPSRNGTQNSANANDFRWTMRALLVGMNSWLTDGAEPPPSRYPRVDKDQLVPLEAWQFPRIPGVALPKRPLKAFRLDFGPQFRTAGIVSRQPPAVGKPYATLLPQVNSDGNETSGIRLPVIQVPLGTYTGWNLRAPGIGAPEELFSMVGSYIPFAATKAERQKRNDPRPSIEERYGSRAEYLKKFEAAARELAKEGYVLESDVARIVEKGAAQFHHQTGAN